MSYQAPLKDMQFVLNELANLAEINQLPGCEDATPDTVDAVLEESAKFCGEVRLIRSRVSSSWNFW